MQNSKTSIRFSLLIIVFITCVFRNFSYSQNIGGGELMIVNNTGSASGKLVKINIYPVGAIFSGGYQYSLDARYRITATNKFIYGYSDILNYNQSLPEQDWTSKINFDANDNTDQCKISLGYGKYKIDFYEGPDVNNFTFVEYCYVDFADANYGTGNFQGEQKFRIDYRSNNNITFNFLSSGNLNNITAVAKNIKVWEQYGSGFPSAVPSKGMFHDTTIASYRNFPIDAKLFGAVDHINPAVFDLNMSVNYQGASVRPNQNLSFLNSSLTISEGIILSINQNQEMIFSGKSSKFITKNGSKVLSPSNFVIRVKDSASFSSDGATFGTNTTYNSWGGIRMDNVSQGSSIINSTFEYADTSVYLLNHHMNPFIFKNNTVRVFRTENNLKKIGLLFKNCSNVLIHNNKFLLPSGILGSTYEFAIHLTNHLDYYQDAHHGVIVTDNYFSNGVYQLDILGYAANLIPVHISGNKFFNGNYNIILRRTIGNIKENVIRNDIQPIFINNSSMIVSQSHISFFGNIVHYPEYNLISSSRSYSNLAPMRTSNNRSMWIGGNNSFSNLTRDNIYSDFKGFVYVDKGRNNFTITNPASRHIFGLFDDTTTFYYANDNCWNGNSNTAKIFVYRTDLYTNQIPHQAIPSNICDISLNPSSVMLFDKGFNVKDSVKILNNNLTGQASGDEILFGRILSSEANNEVNTGIYLLKNLIDNYPNCQYLNPAIFKLYEFYHKLDNLNDETYRYYIFEDLKTYLQKKIDTYQNNREFVKNAYDILLMCLTIRREIKEALSGYEFIALNDPDPSARLLAAFDYLSVSSIINGSGGGQKNNNKKKRDFADISPLNKIVKRAYEESEKSPKVSVNDYQKSYQQLSEKKIISKVADVLSVKHLSNSEKIKKIEDDAMSFLHISYFDKELSDNLSSGQQYFLSQNYPNPFNPVTNITYSISEAGPVSLKVYDVLGKEVLTLVDNHMSTGEHAVQFNGVNLTSGIYFYKIVTNEFSEIRRMILLK